MPPARHCVGAAKSIWKIRAELGNQLREIPINADLKQTEIAKLLSVQQLEVLHLINGHFTRFAIGKLIQLLDR